ncbi:DUF4416 family protein [Mesoaciditoga lauensis]|uniref:DUF4416 family protein n=1 Tax=Mesoaciditoga lauensis TaxID=1495039 RepID=UPI0012E0AFC3|nr:DUF4416 family protein [Mesoaciditoga lauensis]
MYVIITRVIELGKVKLPELVNLVCVIFGSGLEYKLKGVLDLLTPEFGDVDYISKPLNFSSFTSYYAKEMGEKLDARIVSFKPLIHPFELADAKSFTNAVEKKLSKDGKRSVNIDAGYIHHSQFVLASTKQWGNRVYLKHGIYAEVTLLFLKGHFHFWEMTYPNYRTTEYIEELEKIRELYMKKKRKMM